MFDVKYNFLKEKFLLLQIAFLINVSSPPPGFWAFFRVKSDLYILDSKRVRASCWQWQKYSWKLWLSTRKQERRKKKKKENQLADETIVVGEKPERLLKKLSLYKEKKKWAKMKEFFIAVICYLQKNLPLADKLLISAGCLHPENRKNEYIVKNLECLAKCFLHVVQESEV